MEMNGFYTKPSVCFQGIRAVKHIHYTIMYIYVAFLGFLRFPAPGHGQTHINEKERVKNVSSVDISTPCSDGNSSDSNSSDNVIVPTT